MVPPPPAPGCPSPHCVQEGTGAGGGSPRQEWEGRGQLGEPQVSKDSRGRRAVQ